MILDKISGLFYPSGMVCPRCEKPMADHDDQACESRMSRRYFFGVAAGAAAGIASTGIASGIDIPLMGIGSHGLLTSDIVLDEFRKRFELNIAIMKMASGRYGNAE